MPIREKRENLALYGMLLSPPLTQDGISALYVASHNGHSEVVQVLMEKGADPSQTTPV